MAGDGGAGSGGGSGGSKAKLLEEVDISMARKLEICRVCLASKRELVSLFSYRASGSYAEMLTTITSIQVDVNDKLSDKICWKCAAFLDKAIKFKKVAEESDRRFRARHEQLTKQASKATKKINFNSINEIKKEMISLNIKQEPKVELEIEVLSNQNLSLENPADNIKGKDIVICNTVIRKVESTTTEMPALVPDFSMEVIPDVNWKNIKKDEPNYSEYDRDDIANDDFANDSDDDYIPLAAKKAKLKKTKTKTKFKKPKISEIKVFKDHLKKSILKTRKVKSSPKALTKPEKPQTEKSPAASNKEEDRPSTYITCYPLMKNGTKGPPLILKRPKDATILKTHPNYRPRSYQKQKESSGKTLQIQQYNGGKCIPKITRAVRQANIKPREKHVCPICGVLTYGLGNHMGTHSEKKRYSCTQCNRTFAQKNNMLVHLKTHSGVKDHICEVCGAGFYCQKSLLRHNLIHKGERPFGCSLCTKRFIARCDLTRHLRIHSGYKPFKCNVCAMSFNAKHQLQNHERMHTGEKPYSCQVRYTLPSSCRQKSHLNRHMRTHSGVKPFRCDICSQGFYASHHLKNHERMHTGDRPFTCQVCNVAFSYKVNLNNHVYKVHGVNLKFKSIHTITEDILRKEHELINERPNVVPTHILPTNGEENVPQSAAHQSLYN